MSVQNNPSNVLERVLCNPPTTSKILDKAQSFVNKYKANPLTHNAKFSAAAHLPAWMSYSKFLDADTFKQALNFHGTIHSLWSGAVLGVSAAYSCWKSIGAIQATSPEKAYIQSQISSLTNLKNELETNNEITDPETKRKVTYVITKQLIALNHMSGNVSGTRTRNYLNMCANAAIVASGVLGNFPALLTFSTASLLLGYNQWRREANFEKVDPELEDKIGNLETAISNLQNSLPKADSSSPTIIQSNETASNHSSSGSPVDDSGSLSDTESQASEL